MENKQLLFMNEVDTCAKHLKNKNYKIPEWCSLHILEHCDGVGGCWSVSTGRIEKEGESCCKNCEYYKENIERVCGECGFIDSHDTWCSGAV